MGPFLLRPVVPPSCVNESFVYKREEGKLATETSIVLQATKKVQHYKSRYFYNFVTYKFVKCFLLRCLVLPDSVEYKI